jgi:hypothetical protein
MLSSPALEAEATGGSREDYDDRNGYLPDFLGSSSYLPSARYLCSGVKDDILTAIALSASHFQNLISSEAMPSSFDIRSTHGVFFVTKRK